MCIPVFTYGICTGIPLHILTMYGMDQNLKSLFHIYCASLLEIKNGTKDTLKDNAVAFMLAIYIKSFSEEITAHNTMSAISSMKL